MSVPRTGASHFARKQIERHRRLAPVPDLFAGPAKRPMRKVVLIAVGVLGMAILGWWIASRGGDPRTRVEREHGIPLPASARSIQSRGDASRGILDRGVVTVFEMSTNDLVTFMSQLRVKSRTAPVRPTGDPTVNGYNVWPTDSPTFVPGNDRYGGFQRTWPGEAAPIEMLSCSSPTGDWLHVELWRLEGGALLVKMYTDWN
jgi:hypothetical protein